MSKELNAGRHLSDLEAHEGPVPDPEFERARADEEAWAPPAVRNGTKDSCSLEHLGAISDIPVQLSAVLGKAIMPVSQLLRLGRGAVVELDRRVGEPIDILVNNRLVARGEVVVVDERLGVTMTEIIKGDG